MNYQLEFEKIVSYDAGEAGITVNVKLRLGEDSTEFAAKVNTGASFCVFERKRGEEIGLEIENGLRNTVGTATGSSRVFGHEVTLVIEGYKFDAMVYFAEDENFNRNVLGRRGGLGNLQIGIVDYDGKLYLSRYESE